MIAYFYIKANNKLQKVAQLPDVPKEFRKMKLKVGLSDGNTMVEQILEFTRIIAPYVVDEEIFVYDADYESGFRQI